MAKQSSFGFIVLTWWPSFDSELQSLNHFYRAVKIIKTNSEQYSNCLIKKYGLYGVPLYKVFFLIWHSDLVLIPCDLDSDFSFRSSRKSWWHEDLMKNMQYIVYTVKSLCMRESMEKQQGSITILCFKQMKITYL